MTSELLYIGVAFAFLIGISIGSFLNVCIYRLPNNMSVNYPPSHCPNCEHKLGNLDLFPLFSYLFLGRKCRYCKVPISPRYFIIEFITGLIFIAVFLVYGYTINTIIYSLFSACLIVVFMIDFEHYIIPFNLIIFGISLGIIKDIINLIIQSQYAIGATDVLLHISVPFTKFTFPMLPSIVGIVVCGGAFIALTILATLVFRKPAMGGGDILLAAVIGSVIGVGPAFSSFLIAIFLGAIIGVVEIMIRIKRNEENAKAGMIPFGTYMVLGTFIAIFFYTNILQFWHWWLSMAFPPPKP